MKLKPCIPNILTICRIVLIPVILISFIRGYYLLSVIYFVGACFTDFLDGFAARKLKASTPFGAYFDSTADLLLILSLLIYFISTGTISPVCMVFILFMFGQFIYSSRNQRLVYDPVGKYTGVMLFSVILLLLICPTKTTGRICNYIISLYILGAFMLRIIFLRRYTAQVSEGNLPGQPTPR